jgi:catalase
LTLYQKRKKFMTNRKKSSESLVGTGSILSSVAGPSDAEPPKTMPDKSPVAKRLLSKTVDGQLLAAAVPNNSNKPDEYGDAARVPQQGETVEPRSPAATGSTSTEIETSDKVGDGKPVIGENALIVSLDRVRVDSGGQVLTTNQGVPVADNQNSLKVGLRGPTVMEDFILREKITHFDHERIPERVVHARGSAAHGRTVCGRRKAYARIYALLDRRRRTRFGRHGTRRAGIRGKVLYRRRKLGSGWK